MAAVFKLNIVVPYSIRYTERWAAYVQSGISSDELRFRFAPRCVWHVAATKYFLGQYWQKGELIVV